MGTTDGNGDDGTTAVIMVLPYYRGNHSTTMVMGLNFITDTAVIAGLGTAFTVVPRER